MYSLRDEIRKAINIAPLISPEEHLKNILVVFQKVIFSFDIQRFEQFTLFNLVTDAGFTFLWHSKSTESVCPRCGTISNHERHTYKSRVVIDDEILGRPVMHVLRLKQYICDHCKEIEESKTSFVEDIRMICRPYLKTTIALDEKIVNDGIRRIANGLVHDYVGRINVSRETILRRVKEAGGMVTEEKLTETEGVMVLSVDGNNGRKGNPSTACTVVIDAETHDILIVAQGANSEVAKKIFDRFPDAKILSRDRSCAYSKAGDECSLEQVADIFHLIKNAHEAVKKGLSKELRRNIYIREGDGWVELPGNPCMNEKEQPVPVSTIAEEDITERVRLAHLSERQERKYRKVIALLKLYDEGLSTPEISKRLGISSAELHRLLGEAGEVIHNVESKIDKYLINAGTRQCRQKIIGKNARHSSKSIVQPYSDIVMRMVSEGHTHRTIHPVIREMGFEGSANAIYQYILKKRREESTPNVGQSFPTEQNAAPCSGPQRPKRVSLQRVAQGSLYKYALHETAAGRRTAENKDADADVNPKSGLREPEVVPETVTPKTEALAEASAPAPAPSHPRSIFYSDEIADILFCPKAKDDEESKKTRVLKL
jgi:AraC-like DNA-binding protein